jgi:hypothetical protein
MDPISSHDDVVRARRTIAEDHIDLINLLTQHCHSGAESQPDTCSTIDEYSVKVMTSNAHTGTDRLPEFCQLDFGQLSSCVIQNPLMRHADSSSKHFVRKTKRTERTNAVAGEVKASTAGRP